MYAWQCLAWLGRRSIGMPSISMHGIAMLGIAMASIGMLGIGMPALFVFANTIAAYIIIVIYKVLLPFANIIAVIYKHHGCY